MEENYEEQFVYSNFSSNVSLSCSNNMIRNGFVGVLYLIHAVYFKELSVSFQEDCAWKLYSVKESKSSLWINYVN